MYTKPVSDIIQRHGLSHHSYADDTQLYMTMDHSNNDWRDGLARIELCVSEIREWMKQNMLKLTSDIVDNSIRTIIRPITHNHHNKYYQVIGNVETYDMTTDYNKTDGHSPTTRKLTGHNSRKTQSPLSLRPPYSAINLHTANRSFTNIILMADKHNLKNGKMHSNCRLLPEDIVCKGVFICNLMRIGRWSELCVESHKKT